MPTTGPDREQGLRLVREHGSADHWLAVLITSRGDGTPAPAVVNAGVLPHPVTGEPVVAFVARGATAKLTNLRRDPAATLVFRADGGESAGSATAQAAGGGRAPGQDRRSRCEAWPDTNTRARSSSTARSRRPLSSVAKVTYFLTDIADLPDLRTAVDALLPFPRPVASLVEVSALIDAKFRIEVEAIAPASELERPGSRPDRAGFSQLTEGDAMASAAADLGPDGRSAPSVGEVHRSLPVQQMLVAPLPHGHEHGEQGLALATEPVLVTGSRPRFPVGDLLQQTV